MTKTEIVNQSLTRIGALRINDYDSPDSNSKVQAMNAKLHYDQTVKSLLESFDWPFARARADLSKSTDSPPFGYDNKFLLPNDFLRPLEVYNDSDFVDAKRRWSIEGDFLLTDDDEVELIYIRNVESVNEYDSLFIEILTQQLSLKLLPALAGTNTNKFREELRFELNRSLSKVRTSILQANNTTGRSDWNNIRYIGGSNFGSTNYRR